MVPAQLAAAVGSSGLPPLAIVGTILVFYIVLGCVMDELSMILLTVPIFHPVIQGFGYDPIWFGVIIVLVTQMGVITPPVGVNVYVVSGIERSIPLQTVFRGAMPFLLALLVASALLVCFPGIATWLPGRMR
jgi:TRAP-type C4-dicarboxylate transport system permease large subunit